MSKFVKENNYSIEVRVKATTKPYFTKTFSNLLWFSLPYKVVSKFTSFITPKIFESVFVI